MITRFIFILCLLLCCSLPCFADDLEIAMVVQQAGTFVKPFSKTFTVRQQPMPFTLMLTNRSNGSQRIYSQEDARGLKSLSFELTDESGDTFEVRHVKVEQSSDMEVMNFLASGESVYRTLVMDLDQWENVPLIEPGKVKKFQVRVAYDNGGSKIYSEYYTLVLDGR